MFRRDLFCPYSGSKGPKWSKKNWVFINTVVRNIAYVCFGSVVRKTLLQRTVDEAGIYEYRKPYITSRIQSYERNLINVEMGRENCNVTELS
jgi:hypothetical protein